MLTRQQSRQLGLPLDQEQQLPYNPPTNSFACDNMSSTHLPNYDGKPGLAFILFKHDADRYCADKSARFFELKAIPQRCERCRYAAL